VRVLLLSTYDLGRQPFGLASPAAWLKHSGVEVDACDLSRAPLAEEAVTRAAVIAFYLPMHTATRLAVPVIERVRQLNPAATLAAYGLYARLSEPLLRAHGVSVVLGPEAEADLVALAEGLEDGVKSRVPRPGPEARQATLDSLPRLRFLRPDRNDLPPLTSYAALQMPDGTRRVVGATESTRGCKHRCRHCPIVPVYDGQFRVVAQDVVLADIDQQVDAGAEHITFGDPDFFNGPTHARRIVEALHLRHPAVTYDVTVKVEHLLKHRSVLPVLSRTGCLFITSAVESIDDEILLKLDKGHTRADFFEAVQLCEAAGVRLVPTFVAFTPWTTIAGYRELLQTVEELGLVDHVPPVQWGLRLLVTQGSRLLELPDIRTRVQPFDPRTLTHPWKHDDEEVDRLQQQTMRAVGVSLTRSRRSMFATVCALAGLKSHEAFDVLDRATIPYLNEPWYC
jgi:radical SAM superfamily enzyme YgiQ (UPF0313 family)